MNPRDEIFFAQGMLLGIAIFAHSLQQVFAGLDQRVGRLEEKFGPPPPPPRRPRRLVPVGWRDGRRLYHIAGYSG